MPKATTPRRPRRNPLEVDILATGLLRKKPPRPKQSKDDEEDAQKYVDSKASQKILRMARELAVENDPSNAPGEEVDGDDYFGLDSRAGLEGDDEEQAFDNEEQWGDEDGEVEEIEVSPEDLETFNRLLPDDEDPLLKHGWGGAREEAKEENGGGMTLADLILEKIAAHEAASGFQSKGKEIAPPDDDYELPPKVVEVYTQVGFLLSRYKSGKLPKPFKILPTVPHWEDIIALTKPDQWTPNACYEATKIFASSRSAVVQRFMELVILDRVREDIHETKKLNVHLFAALKKGLYKPLAWFKGFLFPLVGSGTCTLREAHIVSGVLARVSIPVLHSAAAIKGLCDIAAYAASQGTEGGGAANMFIKTLLDKKYALPHRVVDELVFHFLRFRSVDPASVSDEQAMKGGVGEGAAATRARLPVIWHQTLLVFAQRYRNDITEDQREALLDLLLTHGHATIGPEIRKELLAGRGRGVPLEPKGAGWDGDDTMLVDG